uniref:Uncharacterized protein n=1 Tax=Coralloluteibacterium stylophorae TaxID=1776034 RepID=A0A8J8B170_9GAMM
MSTVADAASSPWLAAAGGGVSVNAGLSAVGASTVRAPGAAVPLLARGRGATASRGDSGASASAPTEFRIANLDKAGTFRRPLPREYEPTRWDDYWVPEQNLLEEWVARGIKSVSIPIPGTRYKLGCTISVLQFGGGCGLDRGGQAHDPKPPPDVPLSPFRLPDVAADPATPPPDPGVCDALRQAMDAARSASELEAARDAAIERGCTS